MTRNILLVALGMLIMFVLLKIMAKNSGTMSQTTTRFNALAKTQQVANLMRTNEFREVVKTSEFIKFAESLAAEQANILISSLTNTSVTK
jgi:hypothetical protein